MMPNPKTIEGILSSINEVVTVPTTHWNGCVGPGSSSSSSGYQIITRLTIDATSGRPEKVDFPGFVLPDSIGNVVRLSYEALPSATMDEDDKKYRSSLVDLTLDRKYTISS